MASLQDIMNVDDEHLNPSPHKQDKTSSATTPSSTTHQHPSTPQHQRDLSRTSTSTGPHSRATARSAATAEDSHLDSDYIDDTQGSSSMSATTMNPTDARGHLRPPVSGDFSRSPNAPMRPLGSASRGNDVPVKLTPITGRVSRARKGVPVHVCEQCRPAKTFTRAEHLRRHQLSHDKPKFTCTVIGCNRTFHRKDLLDRHQQRHEIEGDRLSKTSSPPESRRPSAASTDGGESHYGHASLAAPAEFSSPGMNMSQSMPGTPAAYPAVSSPAPVPQAGSPAQMSGSSSNYPPPSGSSGPFDYNTTYELHPGSQSLHMLPQNAANAFEQPHFNHIDYQPRSYSPPLCLQTQGVPAIPLPASEGLPELSHRDMARGPSPTSDSTFSTPSDKSHDVWSTPHRAASLGDWQDSSLMPYQTPSSGIDTMTGDGSLYFSYASPPLDSTAMFGSGLGLEMPDFPGEPLLPASHYPPRFTNTVRSPFFPLASNSAQSSEALVSHSGPFFPDRDPSSMICSSRQKETTVLGLGSAIQLQPAKRQPPSNATKYMSDYLEVYWDRFHPSFPVVHRASCRSSSEQHEVLRAAMAAMATQYLSDKSHRAAGYQLHNWARSEIRRFPQWDLTLMQAVLLCEIFARSRGQRGFVRPSNEFQSLCDRIDDPATMYAVAPEQGENGKRWETWLAQEGRRRLRAACFVVDIHYSACYEQLRVQSFDIERDGVPEVPLLGPADNLWNAMSADAWAAVLDKQQDLNVSLRLIEPDSLGAAEIAQGYSPFDRSVIMAYETLQLDSQKTPTQSQASTTATQTTGIATGIDPSLTSSGRSAETARMEDKFPDSPMANTYMALQHTPLLELLAVSGESWVFGHKIPDEMSFSAQKKQLRDWTCSPKASSALVFACRALEGFVSRDKQSEHRDELMDWALQEPATSMWADELSDWWAMYVCALICWAFSYNASSSFSSGMMSFTTAEADGVEAEKAQALEWVRSIACMPAFEVTDVASDKGALSVVRSTAARLDSNGESSQGQLLKDAIRVLRKLGDDKQQDMWF